MGRRAEALMAAARDEKKAQERPQQPTTGTVDGWEISIASKFVRIADRADRDDVSTLEIRGALSAPLAGCSRFAMFVQGSEGTFHRQAIGAMVRVNDGSVELLAHVSQLQFGMLVSLACAGCLRSVSFGLESLRRDTGSMQNLSFDAKAEAPASVSTELQAEGG